MMAVLLGLLTLRRTCQVCLNLEMSTPWSSEWTESAPALGKLVSAQLLRPGAAGTFPQPWLHRICRAEPQVTCEFTLSGGLHVLPGSGVM